MNWYKQAQSKTTENIVFDIYSAITNTVAGEWSVLEDKGMMKTFRLQSYRIIHLDGKNVIKTGDYFWIEVKMFIHKALNVLHPYDGTYENAQNWQEGEKSSLKEISKEQNRWPKEEEKKRWEALDRLKPENAFIYDEQYGNKLISFDVLVYGKKPDENEIPDKVNKLEILFGGGSLEKIDTSHSELDTPTEIAQYINNTINKFYFGDDGGNGKDLPSLPYDPVESIYNPELEKEYNYELV